ncbi:hypothetical protein FGIG_02366 [Fasciola gigantica]|uniref:Uncharacterized protein n=1 Tax=Fasciola gigantica TaxID=46835 RepID=A0A504Y620_FASGI|nr:hypothetical protein FGIG_02366 [Fasciola gigantica]
MDVLARTIVRNLKLLEFDFTAHDLPSDPESFSAYFKHLRKREFIVVLRFLFKTIDPTQYDELMKPGGRLTGSDMVLKNTFHKWLKSLGSVSAYLTVTLDLEPKYHSMDTFQSNLEKLEENAKILRCYVRNLARFRDSLIERRKIAESRLSSTMVDVRHFVESQSQTGLLHILNEEKIMAGDPPEAFQSFLQKLLVEVNTNRRTLRSPFEAHAPKLRDFRTVLSSLNADIPILDGQRLTATHVPTWIVKQLERDKFLPLREGDKIHLQTFVQSMGALFATGCKVLRVPTASDNNAEMQSEEFTKPYSKKDDEIQPDSIGSLCLRIFQRTTDLVGDVNFRASFPSSGNWHTSPISTKTMSSESQNQLVQLIAQMTASIRTLQPMIENVIPKREQSDNVWSRMRSFHSVDFEDANEISATGKENLSPWVHESSSTRGSLAASKRVSEVDSNCGCMSLCARQFESPNVSPSNRRTKSSKLEGIVNDCVFFVVVDLFLSGVSVGLALIV